MVISIIALLLGVHCIAIAATYFHYAPRPLGINGWFLFIAFLIMGATALALGFYEIFTDSADGAIAAHG